jgi:hypothetical protein
MTTTPSVSLAFSEMPDLSAAALTCAENIMSLVLKRGTDEPAPPDTREPDELKDEGARSVRR